ncbi:class I SAM-dependent methyltransferase [Paenibacillus sp. FSL K6-1230]|uniref:class I SAM-dependent methyltransferase n=1 Tax=Paenibacillus sp. FSL K6-1230 TaxID=2921603 RepID=UPI0030F810F7
MRQSTCRFCKAPLKHSFVDLGLSPISNAFVSPEEANTATRYYPLHAFVCQDCFLVQLDEFESPKEIFSDDYAYFSSFSESWLRHAYNYVEMMVSKHGITNSSKVVEIACNDGYLLQYFIEKNVPVLGIEPATNVAKVAEEKGIPVISEFFGEEFAVGLSKDHGKADLIIGNNVLAHVPDINDFVKGMKELLSDEGIITLEFPHLLNLMKENQFDTIYHEHFSYLSFLTVSSIFSEFGLVIFDVEELPTHGSSLRIFAKHIDDHSKQITPAVEKMMMLEIEEGLNQITTYNDFSERVAATKREILSLLIHLKNNGRSIVGYGAPAKGNTLLNYCGTGRDFFDYIVDRSPHKQGKLLPGTLIPVYSPEKLKETRPDIVVIMPWNIKEEIIEQISFVREWGAQFVTLIPNPRVW